MRFQKSIKKNKFLKSSSNNIKNHKVLFVSILVSVVFLLGFFLRFNDLSNNPPALNWDEAAFAYNAKSILETGKDEFGKEYPLYFQSLDDYKLPVYVYMVAVSEKVFGYNNFAVRFPSALFGSLTVLLVFVLVYVLTRKFATSLLSTFIFAILPWHIQFSRMAAEATVGLFFFSLGLVLFLIGLSRKWLLPLAFIFLFISTYTYLSFRVIVPILFTILIIYFRKQIFSKSKSFYITVILIFLFSFILASDAYVHKDANRSTGIGVVSNLSKEYQEDVFNTVVDGKLGINIPRRVLHDSHLMSSIQAYANGYLAIYSPTYLFFDYQQSRHYTPGLGLLYVWMLPFIAIGFFAFRKQKKLLIVLFSLMMVASIPTAYAFDNPNAIRTILLGIPFSILTAIGLIEAGNYLYNKKKYLGVVFAITISLIILFFLYYFYHQNSIHLPINRSQDWQYTRKEMTEHLLINKSKYKKVVVSSGLEWPYIFYLYYSDYDPELYLSNGGTVSGDWNNQDNKIENMEFRRFDYSLEGKDENILFVGKPADFPESVQPNITINNLDGSTGILFVEGKLSEDDPLNTYQE